MLMTDNNNTTFQALLDHIYTADETDLRIISNAVARRYESIKERRTVENLRSLQIGDKVRIRSAKPKYLIGTKAVIVEKKGDKFIIELDENADRRAFIRFGGRPICPASMLEKI